MKTAAHIREFNWGEIGALSVLYKDGRGNILGGRFMIPPEDPLEWAHTYRMEGDSYVVWMRDPSQEGVDPSLWEQPDEYVIGVILKVLEDKLVVEEHYSIESAYEAAQVRRKAWVCVQERSSDNSTGFLSPYEEVIRDYLSRESKYQRQRDTYYLVGDDPPTPPEVSPKQQTSEWKKLVGAYRFLWGISAYRTIEDTFRILVEKAPQIREAGLRARPTQTMIHLEAWYREAFGEKDLRSLWREYQEDPSKVQDLLNMILRQGLEIPWSIFPHLSPEVIKNLPRYPEGSVVPWDVLSEMSWQAVLALPEEALPRFRINVRESPSTYQSSPYTLKRGVGYLRDRGLRSFDGLGREWVLRRPGETYPAASLESYVARDPNSSKVIVAVYRWLRSLP